MELKNNNGHDLSIFVSKIKKQAKNLLKLSKENNNSLNIDKLSQAQEILAQINGYPTWHALQMSMSNSQPLVMGSHSNYKIEGELPFEKSDGIYFIEKDEKYVSYFKVSLLSSKIEHLKEQLLRLSGIFGFPLNLGIHDIELVCENNSIQNNISSYSLYQVGNLLNLTKEDSEILFTITNPYPNNFDTNYMAMYLVIKTQKQYWDSHVELSKLTLEFFNKDIDFLLENIPQLSDKKIESLQMANSHNSIEIENSLLWRNQQKDDLDMLVPKWIYLLNFIQNKKIKVLFKISLSDGKFYYKFNDLEQESMNSAFINSIIKTKVFNSQELIYLTKNEEYIEDKSKNASISFSSVLHKNIFKYKPLSAILGRDTDDNDINLIAGNPGTGKSILMNLLSMSSLVSSQLKKINPTVMIGVDSSNDGVINLLKHTLPESDKDKVRAINVDDNISINIFDLPLGKRKYSAEHRASIINALGSLLNPGLFVDREVFHNYIFTILTNLDKDGSKEKLYFTGGLPKVDLILKKSSNIQEGKTTWWEVVDLLFSMGYANEAIKAQRLAVPVFSDLTSMFLMESGEEDVVLENKEKLSKYLLRVLLDKITKDPFLSKPTNIEINNLKVVSFNLDSGGSNMKGKMSYRFLSILNLVKYTIFGVKYDYEHQYPSSWKKSWTELVKTEDINSVYSYYNDLIHEESKSSGKIYIDEYHRYHNFFTQNEVHSVLRNSRQYGLGVTIATQNLEDLIHYTDFSTSIWLSTDMMRNDKIRSLLKDANILNESELNTCKLGNNLTWAMKSLSPKGKIFNLLKLKMPISLKIALSNLAEDVLIREKLLESNNYMLMIKKIGKFLELNGVKNIKEYVINNEGDKALDYSILASKIDKVVI